MNRILMRVASRGYGWYLALKIGKAVVAVPWFFVTMAAVLVAGVLAYSWGIIKLARDFAHEAMAMGVGYWRRNWFKGFSRQHYNHLHHYKQSPRPVRAIDREGSP